jgi:hypothetical protein
LQGKEYFAKLNQYSGAGAGRSRVFLAPWCRSRLKKKPEAGASMYVSFSFLGLLRLTLTLTLPYTCPATKSYFITLKPYFKGLLRVYIDKPFMHWKHFDQSNRSI